MPYDDRREGTLIIHKRGRKLCVCFIYCSSAAAVIPAADMRKTAHPAAAALPGMIAAAAVIPAAAGSRHRALPRRAALPCAAVAVAARGIVPASAVTAAARSAAMRNTTIASMHSAANAERAATIKRKGGFGRLFHRKRLRFFLKCCKLI